VDAEWSKRLPADEFEKIVWAHDQQTLFGLDNVDYNP
jgi:hypothetical protein